MCMCAPSIKAAQHRRESIEQISILYSSLLPLVHSYTHTHYQQSHKKHPSQGPFFFKKKLVYYFPYLYYYYAHCIITFSYIIYIIIFTHFYLFNAPFVAAYNIRIVLSMGKYFWLCIGTSPFKGVIAHWSRFMSYRFAIPLPPRRCVEYILIYVRMLQYSRETLVALEAPIRSSRMTLL